MKKLLAAIAASLVLFQGCTPKEVSTAKKITKSTVLVHMFISKGSRHGEALCSGVVIAPHRILLADHCVNPPEGISLDKVWVEDYSGHKQLATVVSKNVGYDLALLKIKDAETPARISYVEPKVGSTVWIVGMPLGLEWTVTKGIVSQVHVNVQGFLGSFFITDATVLPGNSGGGAWNDRGELIGIVSMSTSLMGMFGAAGLGIIVDGDTIKDFLY